MATESKGFCEYRQYLQDKQARLKEEYVTTDNLLPLSSRENAGLRTRKVNCELNLGGAQWRLYIERFAL